MRHCCQTKTEYSVFGMCSIVLAGILSIPLISFANGDGHDVDNHYMEESAVTAGIVVEHSVSPKNPIVGQNTEMIFSVRDMPSGAPITNLEIEHEKLMHVIGVRDDLSNFFHIHPDDMGSGRFMANYTFANAGVYKLFTSVRYEGTTHSVGSSKISVSGGGDILRERIELKENVIVGNYQVGLDIHEELTAGKESEIAFNLSDVFSRGLTLVPYLGADMHLVIVKEDLKAFIHAHPSEHTDVSKIEDSPDGSTTESFDIRLVKRALAHVADNGLDKKTLVFNAVFPTAGVYKMFAQFKPEDAGLSEDETLVAEFYVRVGESEAGADDNFIGDGHTDHTHAPVALTVWYKNITWWWLFLVSLVLMTLLSMGVYKYISKSE
jgi:hypothetical protein